MNLPVQTGRYSRTREAMRSHIIEESNGTNVGAASGSYAVDVTGDVNVSGNYYINGVPISTGAQTPWSSDINAATHNLTNVGQLGVGTTTPAYPLDVVGSINCTGSFMVNGVPFTGGVPTTRQVIAGTGLGGGGTLSTDVTLTADVVTVFGRTGDIVAAAGDYTAAQVTNAVSSAGSYADPAWITSLAWSKITGAPAAGVASVFGRTGVVVAASGDYTAAQVTNAVSTAGSYANPAWITSLAYSKLTGAPAAYVLPAATASLLGGVKIGSNISVAADGTISVAAPGGSYTLPPATASVLGGVKIGANITVQADGTISVAAPGAGSQTPWTGPIDAAGNNLNNAGKIGIGTAAPAQLLHLLATSADTNLLIDAANQGAYNPLLTFRQQSVAVWNIGIDTNDAAKLKIANGGNFDNLRTGALVTVASSGNVGIGTTAPVRSLHVGSIPLGGGIAITGGAPNLALSNADTEPNTNAMGFIFALATAATHFALPNPGDSLIATQGTSHGNIYINPNYNGQTGKNVLIPSGNVGIGTASPADVLDVHGRIHLATASGTGAGLWLDSASASNNCFVGYDNSTPNSFRIYSAVAAANVVQIDLTNKYVGINSTAPAYPLDVTGDIHATGTIRAAVSNGVNFTNGGSAICDASGNMQIISASGKVWLNPSTDLILNPLGSIIASTGSSSKQRMTIDSAGHVTINQSDDHSNVLFSQGMVEAGVNFGLSVNGLYNGSAWSYRGSGSAVLLQATPGNVPNLFAAPVGSAGAALSLTQMMTFSAPNATISNVPMIIVAPQIPNSTLDALMPTGSVSFFCTSNSNLQVRVKCIDGTVRQANLTLA